MSIKKKLKALLSKFKTNGFSFEKHTIIGVELKVVRNSLRQNVDQDDSWWFHLAKNHDVIFDIGCNIGYTAILALLQNPNRQILLVDPNPQALQIAAVNLIENGLGSKAHFITAFVSNTIDKQIKFYTVGAGAAGSMHASHAETAASINSYMEVNTVTLDYLCDFYKMKPDLIKIDVEGAETLVMESAKNIAKTIQPTFFIEMHTVENLGMETAGQFMLDWCSELDYIVWYPKTGKQLISADTIKDRGKCHLLLIPNNKAYPNYLKGIDQNSALPTTI